MMTHTSLSKVSFYWLVFSLTLVLCLNLKAANYSDKDVHDLVNNQQVGYYCKDVAAGPSWLYQPGTCGLLRERSMWLDAVSFHTLLNYKVSFNVTDFSIDRGSVPYELKAELGLETGKLFEQGNDDRLWWALAFVRAYQYNTSHNEYLQVAIDVYDDIREKYWDSTCGGGVWWDLNRSYKNAITNELYLTLAIELYQVKKEQTYLDEAKKAADWLMGSHMINEDSLINDGLKILPDRTCVNNGQNTWTYNQGVVLDGLVKLGKALSDQKYYTQAMSIFRAVSDPDNKLVTQDGILVELIPEDFKVNTDTPAFKGAFMRHVGEVIPLATDKDARFMCDFVEKNTQSLWSHHCQYKGGPMLPYLWDHDCLVAGNRVSSTTTFSGLDLLNTAKVCQKRFPAKSEL